MFQILVYMESHDEERIVYKASNFGATNGTYNIKNLEISLERLKTLGSIYFLLPGPKMIWQFGELGYDISINQNGRLGQNQYYGIITMSNKEEMSMTLGHIL